MASTLGQFKVTISPDVAGAGKVTDSVGAEIDGLDAKVGKDGGIGAKLGKGIAAGAAIGVAAIGTLGVAVLKETAAMQQNLGGTEVVFKDQADEMKRWAGQAASSMGVSTNQAMESANIIGSIYQGAGISAEKAAEMTRNMTQRAADSASVMGEDVGVAMEAVTSAAKGNYEMMDRLGVSMTANTLKNYALEKGITTSYSAMTEAEKATLSYEYFMEQSAANAGNFARENQTLAGSFDTLKASWTSVLGSVEDEDVMDGAIDGLVTSIGNVATAITEALPNIVKGVVRIIQEILPALLKEVAALLPEVVPLIVDGLGQAIAAIIEALPEVIRSLGAAINVLIPSLISGIIAIVQALVEALPDIISELVNALVLMAPSLIVGFVQLLLGLLEALPLLLDAIVGIIPALINGLVEQLPAQIPAMVEGLTALFDGTTAYSGTIFELVIGMIPALIMSLLEAFGVNGEAFAAGVGNFFMNIPNELARFAGEAIRNLGAFILELVTTFPARMAEFGAGLVSFFQQLPAIAGQFAQDMVNRFINLPGEMWSIGEDIVWGIINGMAAMWNNLMASIGGFIEGIKDSFLEGLGIHSPSRWMRDHIGENMGLGVGVGLLDSASSVLRDVDAFTQRITAGFDPEGRISMGVEAEAATASAGTVYQTTINQQVPKSDSALDIYLATKRGQLAGLPPAPNQEA